MKIDGINTFLELAAAEARKSPMRKKHGALLLHRGRVIAKGHNRYSSTNGRHGQYCVLPGP